MPSADRAEHPDREFAIGLARAYGGAVIFGLPLLMTMEMWWLGFYMPAWRLALLVALFTPFLVGLSHLAGFEPTLRWRDALIDALVAYAVGCSSSALVLLLFGLVSPGMSAREIIGKIALQAVPASIGALLAQSQLGDRKAGQANRADSAGYASELFIMAAGALFLAFNIAPTQEIQEIGAHFGPLRCLAVIAMALVVTHAFVYTVAFRGRPPRPKVAWWLLVLRFTIPGYVLAMLLSAFLLWCFGRITSTAPLPALQQVIVLSVPAAIGAAAARLIL